MDSLELRYTPSYRALMTATLALQRRRYRMRQRLGLWGAVLGIFLQASTSTVKPPGAAT